MDRGSLVVMGGFVLLLWLHLIFFDRIQAWSARWIVKQSAMGLKVMKLMALGLALIISLVYALMLARAATE